MKVNIGKYPKEPFKERKVKVEVDDHDIWNLDQTLAFIIHPSLLKLKELKHGEPFVDDEDVPEELKRSSAPPTKYEHDTDENWSKRWDYVLDEMIWAFEQKTISWEDQYHSGVSDIQFEAVEGSEGSLFTMVRGPNDTHVFDREGARAHRERMQNGFRLFAKYYSALWD